MRIKPNVVWMARDRDSGLVDVEGDGGGNVGEGVGGQNNGLRLVWEWAPARVGAGGTTKGPLGFRQGGNKVRAKMGVVWP